MRAKIRRRRRRTRSVTLERAPIPTAEWLLETQVSQGAPAWIFAVPGLLVLAWRAVESGFSACGLVGRALRRVRPH